MKYSLDKNIQKWHHKNIRISINQINILLENINIDRLQYKNIAMNFILQYFFINFVVCYEYIILCKMIYYINYTIEI